MNTQSTNMIWKDIEKQKPPLDKKLITALLEHCKAIKKVRRENEQVVNQLAQRTIKEILESGETFYMGSCFDYSISFLWKLKELYPEMKFNLGMEKLLLQPYNIPTLHFFISQEGEDKKYIDFIRDNIVLIKKGEYQNSYPTEVAHSKGYFLKSSEELHEGSSLLSLLEECGINPEVLLHGDKLKKIQNDNTPETFSSYQSRIGNEVKVIVEGEEYSFPLSSKEDLSKELLSTLVAEK